MAYDSSVGSRAALVRVAVLLVLLVGLGFIGYQLYFEGEDILGLHPEADGSHASPSRSHTTNRQSSNRPGAVSDMSPEHWSGALQLSPDRRFLDALAQVDHLLDGRSKRERPTAGATYTEQKMWVVTYRGEEAGQLDPLPTAKSMSSLLDDYARDKVGGAAPRDVSKDKLEGIDDTIDAFHPPRLFDALAEIGSVAEGKPVSGRLALASARALTYLVVQGADPLEMTDPVASRALAALAIAKQDDSVDEHRIREVEALLLASLGYTGRAGALAKRLDADHPVAAFLGRDQRGLDEQAARSELARFLLLRLAEQRTDAELWKTALRRHYRSKLPSAASIATARRFVSFRAMPHVESNVRDQLADELSGSEGDFDADSLPVEERDDGRKRLAIKLLESKLSTLFDVEGEDFDEAIEEAVERSRGRVLDDELIEAYARSEYLGSVYREANFYIDSLSAPKIAASSVEALRTDGPQAEAMLREYLQRRIDTAEQGADLAALRGLVDSAAALGGRVVLSSYAMAARNEDWGSPANFRLARRLTEHLDSRLEHRADFATNLYSWAWEVPVTDRLVLSLMDAAPVRYRSQIGWYARRNGDVTALERLMKHAAANSEELLPLLRWYLELDEASGQVAKRQFERLMAAEPARWSVRKEYSEFLFDKKAYEEAERVITAWLRDHGPGLGLEEVFARTRISRARRLAGNAPGAWKAISPKVSSQQAGAMVEGARVLEAQGDLARAERLLRQAVKRYPNTAWTRAALVEFFWKHDKFEQAAKFLAQAPSQHDFDWSKYTDAFFEAFNQRELGVMADALDALQKAGLSPLKLRGMAAEFANDEQWGHAFELSSRLRFQRIMLVAENAIKSYRYLKQAEGEQRARRWLGETAIAKRPGILGMMAYQEGQDELLWELLSDPPDNDNGHATWKFRAAAYHRAGKEHPERRRRLEEHYARQSSNWYHRLGKLVWSGEAKEALISDATSEKKQCEVAYWIGLKAQFDGDYAGASDWYHVALLTGASNNGEYHWAADELYGWVDSRHSYSLARLERDKPILNRGE